MYRKINKRKQIHCTTENRDLWKITEHNKSSLDGEMFAMSLITIKIELSLVIPKKKRKENESRFLKME